MRMYDIIKKKKEGGKLSREEIDFFVNGYTNGLIPDEQISALLMAICFRSMDMEETAMLTQAITSSGEVTDLSPIEGIKVDKHSSGGVGDKTTLIVAPLVAACGVKVAKMSGRGLGHTGGTIDKLESIPHFRTSLSPAEFFDAVKKAGLAVAGQTGDLAPADKKLYALRDVTATVDCLPLIASSIMGKKLASGADAIVLDVKVGNGSFNKTTEDGLALADAMVEIGTRASKKMIAVISDMSRPLGRQIGNALEVKEAVSLLRAEEADPALKELCLTLAASMLFLAEKGNEEECRMLAENALLSGEGYLALRRMVEAQGGDVRALDDPSLLPSAEGYDVLSPAEGYITDMNTERYGTAALMLGAGRNCKEDKIDAAAGITVYKKTGDYVKRGEAIARLYASDTARFEDSEKTLLNALSFGTTKPNLPPIIHRVIKGGAL